MNNSETIKTLQDQAYRYYPYGINFFDEEYSLSPEALLLQETKTLKAKLLKKKWNTLAGEISDLALQYDIEVQDWTQELFVDPCFKLVLILKSTNKKLEDCVRLVLYLSILIPYYLVYQSIHSPDSKNIHEGRYSSVSYNIPLGAEKYADMLRLLIAKHFSGYTYLNHNVAQTTIENIMYNGNGNIAQKNANAYRSLTIFNAFFTSHFL